MYSKPNMTDPTDRLAHLLSEMHNDNAPFRRQAAAALKALKEYIDC